MRAGRFLGVVGVVAALTATTWGGAQAASAAGVPITAYQPQWLASDDGGNGILELDVLAAVDPAQRVAATTPYPEEIPAGYDFQFARRSPTTPPLNYFPASTGTGASLTDPGVVVQIVCVDFFAGDPGGSTYAPTTWADSGVRSVGLAARAAAIAEPFLTDALIDQLRTEVGYTGTESDANIRGAALQMAVWYAVDGVIAPPYGYTRPGVTPEIQQNSAIVRAATAALVTEAQQQGDYAEPLPAFLDVTPSDAVRSDKGIAGPYTVTSNGSDIVVEPGGAQVYLDAAATQEVAPGTSVPSGTQLWTRTSPGQDGSLSVSTVAEARLGTISVTSGDPQETMLLGTLTGTSLTAGATSSVAPPTPPTTTPTPSAAPALANTGTDVGWAMLALLIASSGVIGGALLVLRVRASRRAG